MSETSNVTVTKRKRRPSDAPGDTLEELHQAILDAAKQFASEGPLLHRHSVQLVLQSLAQRVHALASESAK